MVQQCYGQDGFSLSTSQCSDHQTLLHETPVLKGLIIKRYRHYKKDTAIILSCFGSVVEQDKYFGLQKVIEEKFENIPVYVAFNSRMVLKMLKKKGQEFKNTIQTLADCDMEGYRRMVVTSVNLFPTSEHEELQKVIEGFNHFSPSHIRGTRAIFSKNKTTTAILQEIDTATRQNDPSILNLYIIHGAPELEQGGIASITYAQDLLQRLNPRNFFCSLEGSFPFHVLKASLIREMSALADGNQKPKVQVIPLLLVSGNHFDKDVVEIRDGLQEHFDITIAPSLSGGEKFNLIELDSIRQVICEQIQEEMTKLG